MKAFPVEKLRAWFLRERRDLPWRRNRSPYFVWLSEVMLQQTQVSVVIDYFQRWIVRFPTMASLARASWEEVIKMWEGLGYYSRARRLHAAAQIVLECHGGELPPRREDLEKIPGLGPYTVGAILNFAFQQKAPAVDGNTTRVLTRYFGIAEDIAKVAVRERIWTLAEQLLPDNHPWEITEGLIELGACVCTPKPKCELCPLQGDCIAYREGLQASLPHKTKASAVTLLEREVLIVYHGNELLLKHCQRGQVMADLYEFPYFEVQAGQEVQHLLPLKLDFRQALKREDHSFTRYRARLYPSVWEALEKKALADYDWIPWSKIKELPFSSGHRRILQRLEMGHAPFAH